MVKVSIRLSFESDFLINRIVFFIKFKKGKTEESTHGGYRIPDKIPKKRATSFDFRADVLKMLNEMCEFRQQSNDCIIANAIASYWRFISKNWRFMSRDDDLDNWRKGRVNLTKVIEKAIIHAFEEWREFQEGLRETLSPDKT